MKDVIFALVLSVVAFGALIAISGCHNNIDFDYDGDNKQGDNNEKV